MRTTTCLAASYVMLASSSQGGDVEGCCRAHFAPSHVQVSVTGASEFPEPPPNKTMLPRTGSKAMFPKLRPGGKLSGWSCVQCLPSQLHMSSRIHPGEFPDPSPRTPLKRITIFLVESYSRLKAILGDGSKSTGGEGDGEANGGTVGADDAPGVGAEAECNHATPTARSPAKTTTRAAIVTWIPKPGRRGWSGAFPIECRRGALRLPTCS
jgi:hypothetical protein